MFKGTVIYNLYITIFTATVIFHMRLSFTYWNVAGNKEQWHFTMRSKSIPESENNADTEVQSSYTPLRGEDRSTMM